MKINKILNIFAIIDKLIFGVNSKFGDMTNKEIDKCFNDK